MDGLESPVNGFTEDDGIELPVNGFTEDDGIESPGECIRCGGLEFRDLWKDVKYVKNKNM